MRIFTLAILILLVVSCDNKQIGSKTKKQEETNVIISDSREFQLFVQQLNRDFYKTVTQHPVDAAVIKQAFGDMYCDCLSALDTSLIVKHSHPDSLFKPKIVDEYLNPNYFKDIVEVEDQPDTVGGMWIAKSKTSYPYSELFDNFEYCLTLIHNTQTKSDLLKMAGLPYKDFRRFDEIRQLDSALRPICDSIRSSKDIVFEAYLRNPNPSLMLSYFPAYDSLGRNLGVFYRSIEHKRLKGVKFYDK